MGLFKHKKEQHIKRKKIKKICQTLLWGKVRDQCFIMNKQGGEHTNARTHRHFPGASQCWMSKADFHANPTFVTYSINPSRQWNKLTRHQKQMGSNLSYEHIYFPFKGKPNYIKKIKKNYYWSFVVDVAAYILYTRANTYKHHPVHTTATEIEKWQTIKAFLLLSNS